MTEKLTVLVVDDEPTVAMLHHRFADAHPSFVVVGEAYDGASALEALDRLRPDVVLLDVYLPDMTGIDVLRQLRAGPLAHIDVILVTAARDLDTVREARAGGVRHYLVKPFTAAGLRARLDEIARHHEAVVKNSTGSLLTQHSVDEIITAARPDLTVDLPKGIADASLQRIVAQLQSSDADVSAAEIAEAAGVSRVTARRYLEYLVEQGMAVSTPRYGKTGRPENRFRAAP